MGGKNQLGQSKVIMRLNKIEELFAEKALIKSNIFLLASNDAVDFINESQRKNIKILGVDVFYLIQEKIRPTMEKSIDFTSRSYVEKNISNYDVARTIIENARDLYFEIVIDC